MFEGRGGFEMEVQAPGTSGYENMDAVSRALRVYGKVLKIGGLIICLAGLVMFVVGLDSKYMEDLMKRLTGVLLFLGGAGIHGAGVLLGAAGESVLALKEIALNTRGAAKP